MGATFPSVYNTNQLIKTFSWTSVSVSTSIVPSDSTTTIEIPYDTKSIVIQFDTTSASCSSTNMDLNVQSSPNGTNWDTEAYNDDIQALASAKMKTILVTPGPQEIRLRLDNNDSTAVAATARVLLRG